MSDAQTMKFGVFSMREIYEGRWWALITSPFVHIQPMHIFFNMYWVWGLGPALERKFGSIPSAIFVIVTAYISSGWDIATGVPGIGFSGVVYEIVGFGWIARDKYPDLRPYFNDRLLQICAVWGVACIFLTYFHIQNVANVAHIMGLASGLLIAWTFIKKKVLAGVGLAFVAGAAIVPVYYSPFSADWNFFQGVKAHDRKDLTSALRYYHRSVDLGFDDPAAWHNIVLIEASRQHRSEFEHAMQELKKIDPKDADELMKSFTSPE